MCGGGIWCRVGGVVAKSRTYPFHPTQYTTPHTMDHFLFECELINKERDNLISTILKTDVWPLSKDKLIRENFKIFSKFTNQMSFDNLNEV